MRVSSIQCRYSPIFGIYKGKDYSDFGEHTYGQYKDYNIEIYYDKKDKTKLFYVSDMVKRWVRSKLIYYEHGIKKIMRSSK